jgi:hypothetical protein
MDVFVIGGKCFVAGYFALGESILLWIFFVVALEIVVNW